MTEVYPETPEVQDSWGCDYLCDPSWQQRGDDFGSLIYFHQCSEAGITIYTADGLTQSRHVMRIIDELKENKQWNGNST